MYLPLCDQEVENTKWSSPKLLFLWYLLAFAYKMSLESSHKSSRRYGPALKDASNATLTVGPAKTRNEWKMVPKVKRRPSLQGRVENFMPAGLQGRSVAQVVHEIKTASYQHLFEILSLG